MHVYVHRAGRQGEEENCGRESPARDEIAIREQQTVTQNLVPHRATVYEEVDAVGAGARMIGRRHEGLQVSRGLLALDSHESASLPLSQDRRNAIHGVETGGPHDGRAIVAAQLHGDRGKRQGKATHPIGDVPPLGPRLFQELAPSRHSGEEVRDFDPRPLRSSRLPLPQQPPILHTNFGRFGVS